MIRSVIRILLCARLTLSVGCGADSYAAPKQRTATAVPSGTVQPGAGEPTVIGAGEDEPDALYVWATGGARSLSVGTSSRVCKPGGDVCRDMPESVCASVVETEVCQLDQLDAEPRCAAVTLRLGEPVTVPVSARYAALRLVHGTCLDAVRLETPIQPGRQWWRQSDPGHPRGWIVDMADGGGTPQVGGDGRPATIWYTHPVGGPR